MHMRTHAYTRITHIHSFARTHTQLINALAGTLLVGHPDTGILALRHELAAGDAVEEESLRPTRKPSFKPPPELSPTPAPTPPSAAKAAMESAVADIAIEAVAVGSVTPVADGPQTILASTGDMAEGLEAMSVAPAAEAASDTIQESSTTPPLPMPGFG